MLRSAKGTLRCLAERKKRKKVHLILLDRQTAKSADSCAKRMTLEAVAVWQVLRKRFRRNTVMNDYVFKPCYVRYNLCVGSVEISRPCSEIFIELKAEKENLV